MAQNCTGTSWGSELFDSDGATITSEFDKLFYSVLCMSRVRDSLLNAEQATLFWKITYCEVYPTAPEHSGTGLNFHAWVPRYYAYHRNTCKHTSFWLTVIFIYFNRCFFRTNSIPSQNDIFLYCILPSLLSFWKIIFHFCSYLLIKKSQ
jgi:hypothetical protein